MKEKRQYYTQIIFSNYFDLLDDPEMSDKDIADFARALRAFCEGNFEYNVQNRAVRGYMHNIRKEMAMRHKAYLSKCDRLRKIGSKGGKASKRKNSAVNYPVIKGPEAPQSGENSAVNYPVIKGPDFTPTQTPNKSDIITASGSSNCKAYAKQMLKSNEKSAKNGAFSDIATASGSSNCKAYAKQMLLLLNSNITNFNKNPLPLQGVWAGGGFVFIDYFIAFGRSLALDMPEGLEASQADLLRWHCSANDGEKVLKEAKEAARASDNASGLAFRVTDICQRALKDETHVLMPRPAWRLCSKLAALAETPEGLRLGGLTTIVQAFALEIKRALDTEGEALWPLLQAKAEYIASGKNIKKLGAFLSARK